MESPPFYQASVLFCAALTGAVIYLLTHKQSSKGIKLLLSFSAAYLLGLSLLHLFPELFSSGVKNPGWFVLGGFMLQVILDFFSHGVEHGHAHHHKDAGTRFLVSVMASLWIHAFIEGMPFGGAMEGHVHDHGGHVHDGLQTHDHSSSLLLGISLHKVTETLVFTALLIGSGVRKNRAILLILAFALVAPAGAFIHYYFGDCGIESLTPKITGVLIGILLHVSTTIIFESEEGHRFNWIKFLSIILGIGMAAAIS